MSEEVQINIFYVSSKCVVSAQIWYKKYFNNGTCGDFVFFLFSFQNTLTACVVKYEKLYVGVVVCMHFTLDFVFLKMMWTLMSRVENSSKHMLKKKKSMINLMAFFTPYIKKGLFTKIH